MRVMKRVVLVAVFLMSSLLILVDSTLAKSVIDLPLERAVKTDFFTFFHLTPQKKIEKNGLVRHLFQPSRKDVAVVVETDTSGTIKQMSLAVGREFIDNKKTSVFARDLVKSFIDAATRVEDEAQTRGLCQEIFLRRIETTKSDARGVVKDGVSRELDKDESISKIGKGKLKKGDVAIIMKGPMPKFTKRASNGFLTFKGSKDNYEKKLSHGRLIMKNHMESKSPYLEVRIDRAQ